MAIVPRAVVGAVPSARPNNVTRVARANVSTGPIGAADAPIVPQGAFDGSARGAVAVGRGLQDAAQVLGGLALKQAEARNVSDTIDADVEMASNYAKFEEWRATEPDESKWEEELRRRQETEKEAILSEDLSPAARQNIEARLARFNGNAQIDTAKAATKRTFERGKDSILTAVEMGIRDRNLALVEENVKAGVNLGIFYEGEADRVLERAEKAIAAGTREDNVKMWMDQAETEPEMVLDAIDEAPGLEREDRENIRRYSRSRSRTLRGEEFDAIGQRIMEGDFLTADSIEAEAGSRLTKKDRQDLIAMQREIARNEPIDADKVNQLDFLAEQWDPNEDPNLDRYKDIQKLMAVLPSNVTGYARHLVNTKSMSRNNVIDETGQLFEDGLRIVKDWNTREMRKIDAMASGDEPEITQEEADRMRANQSRIYFGKRAQVEQWIGANPDKPSTDLSDFVFRLVGDPENSAEILMDRLFPPVPAPTP